MKRMKLDDPSQLWEPKDHNRLCCEYFVRGEPSEDPEHPGYVPSLFCFTPMAKTRIDTSRYQRRVQRRLALTPVPVDENQDIAANALLHLNSPKFVDKGTDPGPDPKDARLKELETQVNDLASNYSSLQQEYQRLLEENRTLKQELGEKKSHIQI
ncbi:uncharacterized protein LOC127842937 [Dreissena polymorpha]|uniref:uncharacterized protein LOC127842937 n=1 Tax=Dreissena polymorpha TaxID=45954 RepID=UPI00226525A4|nr:uncharacterized protein LOC127842937 [Dreissena polymorpha]